MVTQILLGLVIAISAAAAFVLTWSAWGRQRKPLKWIAFGFSVLAASASVAAVVLSLREKPPAPAPSSSVPDLAGKRCWPVCWVRRGDGEICCGNPSTLEECAGRGGGVGEAFKPGRCSDVRL